MFLYGTTMKQPDLVFVFLKPEVMEFCPILFKYKSSWKIKLYEEMLNYSGGFDVHWLTKELVKALVKVKKVQDRKSNCVEVTTKVFFDRVFGENGALYHHSFLQYMVSIVDDVFLEDVTFPSLIFEFFEVSEFHLQVSS